MGIRVISNIYKIGVVAPSVELRSGEHKDATRTADGKEQDLEKDGIEWLWLELELHVQC
jgi:hypothetical protein